MTGRGSTRRRSAEILLALASVGIALGLAEGVLRMALPWSFLHPPVPDYAWMAHDPRLGMINVPGFAASDPRISRSHAAGSLRIDERGFRGAPVSDARPPGRLRVVCLGDSSTFGIHLRAGVAFEPSADFRLDSDYPRLLGDLLRARGADVEVVNAGVLGYHSGHGLRQLRTAVLPLAPDVVTVRFGFNEHAFMGPATHVQDAQSALARRAFYAVDDLVVFQLALARYARPLVTPAVSPARFRENLVAMIAELRARGIDAILVDYPLRAIERGATPGEALPFLGTHRSLAELHAAHRQYQEALAAVASAEHVPIVRTAGALAASDQAAFSDADLAHPTPYGAALIAAALADALAPPARRRP